MDNYSLLTETPPHIFDEAIFVAIVNDLLSKGFSVQKKGVPEFVIDALLHCKNALNQQQYQQAGIGRDQQFMHHKKVRTDEICWIDGSTEEGRLWLDWCECLRLYINRHLFMGLFSFESHFSCYRAGDFYRRHFDAFQGESNRVLSLVTYLNDDWQPTDGGTLVLYENNADEKGIKIQPEKGTIVVFLSELFPHEVLPSYRERHSVAGWFRLNASINHAIDPPK